ncbi:MAG TPA: glycoside hydrolase domain-containing protein, partial [Pseudonocardiaceae bacterium]
MAGGIATVVLAGAGTAMAVASSTPDVQHVSYLGLNFTVPASWTVTNLTAGSTTCVRYDQHVVYLGTPGTTENCPANLIGRTEALLVQPTTASGTTAIDDTVSAQINMTTPTASITATYGDDKAAVTDVLASAGLPAATPKPTTPTLTPHALAAVAQLPVTATDSTGQGFDACTAPGQDQMAEWKAASPFSTVGIYLGGSDAACGAGNLNATWTAAQSAAGWHFMPIWVGPQAESNQITNAQSQGTTNADAAITSAQ